MRNILFALISFMLITLTMAQSPELINYQAIIRDADGNLIKNSQVGMRISILQNTSTGNAVYVEEYTINSNANGLVTFEIGRGTQYTPTTLKKNVKSVVASSVSGSFSDIDWSNGPFFIKVETDPTGGTDYSIIGKSQLLSVPYALHAKTVENIDDADADPTNEIQSLSLTGTFLELSNGGGSVTLPTSDSIGGDNWGAQTVKTDASLSGNGTWTNPLSVVGGLYEEQTLSVLGNTLSISGGNTITLPNTSKWDSGAYGISYTDNHVGIGMSADALGSLSVMNTNSTAIFAGNNNASNAPLQAYNQNIDGAAAWFRNKIRISDGTEGEDKVLTSDADGNSSWQTPISFWTASGTSIYRNTGNVGIGTIPSYLNKLEISGGNLHIDKDHHLTIGTRLALYESVLNTFLSTTSGGYLLLCASQDATVRPRLIIEPNGDVEIKENLMIDKKIKIEDGTEGVGKVLTSDANGLASWQIPAKDSCLWTEKGDNIYRNSGKIGLGTTTPSYNLDLFNSSDKTDIRIKSNSSNAHLKLDKAAASDYANIVYASSGINLFFTGLMGDNNYLIKSSSATQNGIQVANSGNVSMFNNLNVLGNVGLGTTTNATAPLEIKSDNNPALIIGSSTTNSPNRPGIQFKNNTSQWIAGDDGSDEIFGFYSRWTNARTYDAKLRVYGNATSSWGKYIQLTHDGTDGFISTDEGDIDIAPNGNVGIKTNAPTQTLDVNGNMRVRSIPSGSGTYAIVIDSDGTFKRTSSDKRLKENIHSLDNSLDKILKLRGVSFTWKDNPEYGKRIGFIAQEFEKVIPELSFTNPVDGYKGINYAEITAVLVEAVKTQQKQIEALKAENSRLKSDNSAFESRLITLENKMAEFISK